MHHVHALGGFLGFGLLRMRNGPRTSSQNVKDDVGARTPVPLHALHVIQG